MKKFIALLSLVICVALCACSPVQPSPSASANGEPEVRAYIFRGSQRYGASLTLMAQNRFQFRFSATSSYLGIGNYTFEDGKVVLETQDGKYHYVFTVSGNTLVFDGKNSSTELWNAEFKDGSVFE